MSAPLAEVVEEGRELRSLYEQAVEEGLDSTANLYWDQLCEFFDEHGPRLLAVAEAVPPLLAYLEEEVLEAKTCEGQDEQTGKPCEWHAILLALDAAARGEKAGV